MGRKSYDGVKWTGKNRQFEYWECNACWELAGNMTWLEDLLEKLYGARCKDCDSGCACCQAWGVYDAVREETGEKR